MICRTTSLAESENTTRGREMDKGEKIKDQGFVPYAKQKTIATSKGPKPGAGKGKSRGKGAALRGIKFTGVY